MGSARFLVASFQVKRYATLADAAEALLRAATELLQPQRVALVHGEHLEHVEQRRRQPQHAPRQAQPSSCAIGVLIRCGFEGRRPGGCGDGGALVTGACVRGGVHGGVWSPP